MVKGEVVSKTSQTSVLITKGMTRPSGLFILALILMPIAWVLGAIGLTEISAFMMFLGFFLIALIPLIFKQVPPHMPQQKMIFFMFITIIGIAFGLIFRYAPNLVGIGG